MADRAEYLQHGPELIRISAERQGVRRGVEVPQVVAGVDSLDGPRGQNARVNDVAMPRALGPGLEALVEVLEVVPERTRMQRRVIGDP